MSEDSDRVISHELLMRELCKVVDWDVLGIYLGLNKNEIIEIERDYQSNVRRRRIEMLAKWMNKDVDILENIRFNCSFIGSVVSV